MTIRNRTVRAIAWALAAAVTLGACTATEPPPPTDERRIRTSSPDSSFTLVADTSEQAASIATSIALFDESAVVVVAPVGDPAAQTLAAEASVALRVPLLIAQPEVTPESKTPAEPASPADADSSAPADTGDVALDAELARLKATTVLSVGDALDGEALNNGSPTGDSPGPHLQIVTATASAEAIAEAAATLPTVSPAPPLDDTLALVLDDAAQTASIATVQAAGVAVQLLPTSTPNPQATATAVEALHGSSTTKTLAIGAAFAREDELAWKIRAARTGAQLPGGGQLLFPGHQFIALYGTPGTPSMGVLGEQDVAAAIQRAQDVAAPYAALTDKTVVPMFEIIATVASESAGTDGNYSNELDPARLRPWIDAAAAAGVYVVLDLQPGRTDFLTQAKLYEDLLVLPNVGLAIDPEWRLAPDQVHLKQIGGVDASEVNAVSQWLAELTNSNALPQKMLVLHQFRLSMLRDRSTIDVSHPELAMLIHADGLGAQPDKQATWRALHQDAPTGVAWGWKNFYDEDAPMLNPEQTVQEVSPVPDLVTYQ